MTNMMPDSGKMKLRCFLSRPQYLWPKYTAATITTARMPARDPERIMDRVIIADAANPKRRIRLLFRMTARQKGKPAERHAAKPAGLSKLPVMSNPRLT